jgi:hypothetical protein
MRDRATPEQPMTTPGKVRPAASPGIDHMRATDLNIPATAAQTIPPS